MDESEDALAGAMSQAERYGEDPANFAGQPRVSFRSIRSTSTNSTEPARTGAHGAGQLEGVTG